MGKAIRSGFYAETSFEVCFKTSKKQGGVIFSLKIDKPNPTTHCRLSLSLFPI